MPRSRANVRPQHLFGECPHGGAVREERGLRVTGCSELVGRALETQSAEIDAKRGIDLAKNAPGDGKRFRQIFSHSRLL
jgi:hypothetical protein